MGALEKDKMSPYFVLLFSLLKLASGLTDKEKTCMQENAGALDNNYMVGTWYEVYRFSMRLNLPPTSACANIKITKATADDVERYKTAHGDVEPFKFDTTAVLFDRDDGRFTGMLTGNDQVKIYAWDPKSVFFGTEKYAARVYKKVNEEYMLFNTCAIPITKNLLSRRRNQTEEELQQIIATIQDVKRLETQRFCSN